MHPKRGTPEWRVVEMNSRGIPKFLTDLRNLDRVGFDEGQCNVIKDALNAIINSANGLDHGRLFRQLVNVYEEFLRTYIRWNGNGTDTSPTATLSRRAHLRELIETNRKVTTSIKNRRKKNTLTVSPDDESVVTIAYQQFRAIVNSNPGTFVSLASSVKSYETAVV